ncbi:MAG: N-methyl-L-tryptophan oxidase [Vicinamibacterales bacterium]
MHYDVIVIGVGGMGSAAVYHLARRGARVLGLERFGIPNDRGSSHGATRIIRLAYAEHPFYVPLLRRAYALWRALETTTGEPLLVTTGGLDIGMPDSDIVRGTLASCERHDLAHEVLAAPAVHARFPGYRLPDDFLAVWQRDGGYLLSERAIVSHVDAARRAGADVRAHARVEHWDSSDRGVRVVTTSGTYEAGHLVITAGPWAASLVPALAAHVVPERQGLLWTAPAHPGWYTPERFPIFNMDAPEGRFYGFPSHAGTGFKIGRYHHRFEPADPDAVDREFRQEDEAVLREGIARYFPGANGPALAHAICLFTNSPDEHFIIDHLPGEPRVAVAAGFSGHGYKFCSVVGEILADFTLEGGSSHDVSLFRQDRLVS